MADRLNPERRRLNMSRIRARNISPGWTVRRLVNSCGFRYLLHRGELPSKIGQAALGWRSSSRR
ncbi:hypothetical protein J3S89_13310 [Pinisolibacter sp. B13]|nr:hypothetical protein [Pinisolibacter aquiterrae]MCC8235591.1 hypothetical protein [Pinisolibacter aquiterrae]